MKGPGWMITVNHIDNEIISGEIPAHLTIPFKLYDDDDELYFEGLMSQKLHDAGEHIFDPLDSAPAAYGCTGMKVKGPDWVWV